MKRIIIILSLLLCLAGCKDGAPSPDEPEFKIDASELAAAETLINNGEFDAANDKYKELLYIDSADYRVYLGMFKLAVAEKNLLNAYDVLYQGISATNEDEHLVKVNEDFENRQILDENGNIKYKFDYIMIPDYRGFQLPYIDINHNFIHVDYLFPIDEPFNFNGMHGNYVLVEYDENERLIAIYSMAKTAMNSVEEKRVEYFTYDEQGNLLAVDDFFQENETLSHTTTYNYDENGRIYLQERDMTFEGETSYEFTDEFTYTTDGKIKSRINSTNYSVEETIYNYDETGLINNVEVEMSYVDGDSLDPYNFKRIEFDKMGNVVLESHLLYMNNTTSTAKFKYDDQGRIISQSYEDNLDAEDFSYEIAYEYDEEGYVTRETIIDANCDINYAYTLLTYDEDYKTVYAERFDENDVVIETIEEYYDDDFNIYKYVLNGEEIDQTVPAILFNVYF